MDDTQGAGIPMDLGTAFDAETAANPQPMFKMLREHAPVLAVVSASKAVPRSIGMPAPCVSSIRCLLRPPRP